MSLSKKTLSAAIVAVLLLGTTTAMAANPFTDVPEERFFTDAVEWAYSHDITHGTTDTTFGPHETSTRAQTVTFTYRYDQTIVQPALDALRADIGTNAAAVATVASGLAATEGEVDTVQAGLAGAEADIDTLETDLAAAEADIDEIEVALTPPPELLFAVVDVDLGEDPDPEVIYGEGVLDIEWVDESGIDGPDWSGFGVTFDRDVNQCAFSVTPAETSGMAPVGAMLSATVAHVIGAEGMIAVEIWFDGEAVAADFHIMVMCPPEAP